MNINTVADLKRALTPGTPIVMTSHSLTNLPRAQALVGVRGIVKSVHSYGIEILRESIDSKRTFRLDWPKSANLIGGENEFAHNEEQSSQRMALRISYAFGEGVK